MATTKRVFTTRARLDRWAQPGLSARLFLRPGARCARHGATADFYEYIECAPENLRPLFDTHESIPYQRRHYLAEGMYDEIIRRLLALEAQPQEASFSVR